jgi:hypothetical protein
MRKILTAGILAAAVLVTASVAQAGKPGGQSGQSSKSKPSFKPTQQGIGQSQKGLGQIQKGSGQDQKGLGQGQKGLGQGQKGFNKSQNFLQSKGKKFSQGYFYCDKHCNHWTHQCFWPRYGCECYYCPHAVCWYYWCEPRCCYLPVSCIEYAEPVTVTTTVVNSPTIVVSQGSASGPPSDLPPVLPGGPQGAGQVLPFKAGAIKP